MIDSGMHQQLAAPVPSQAAKGARGERDDDGQEHPGDCEGEALSGCLVVWASSMSRLPGQRTSTPDR